MSKSRSIISALALSASLGFLLPACSSDGVTRVSAIGPGGAGQNGQQGPQGPQGEQGPAGPQGPQGEQGPAGPQGAQGPAGADGQDGNFNLGDAGALAVGGLVGPNGVAGTGLLANTGDPDNRNELISHILEQSGREVSSVAVFLAHISEKSAPGAAPITGTVVDVLHNTGQSLIMTANGDAYLVDGMLAAPGTLLTATLGGATLIGDVDVETLIGASVFSAAQLEGQLVTAGVGSAGDLATADVGGVIDLLAATLQIESPQIGATIDALLPDQDLIVIHSDSTLGVTVLDGLPVANNISVVDSLTGALGGTGGLGGALEPVLAGGDVGGALDPALGGPDGLTGAIEPVLAGGEIGGALNPVLDTLGGGDLGGDLTGALDPVLEPVTGDDGLLGDALDPVTGEDGLLGGLLGGGN
ncbi:MAG: collagen-like protein [Oricola sp.]|jgi:hypothetical protein|nr:collagen-like protein [Oricola sp.]